MDDGQKATSEPEGTCLLFVYGQLQPSLRPPQSCRRSWPDQMRGRLFDLGPYPAAVDVGVGNEFFRGYVLEIDTRELTTYLDPYEAVDEGVYRRRRATTEGGVEVWIYEYARPLPAHAVGPIPCWPQETSPMPLRHEMKGARAEAG